VFTETRCWILFTLLTPLITRYMLYSSVGDEISKIVVAGEFMDKRGCIHIRIVIRCALHAQPISFINLKVLDTEYSPFTISVSVSCYSSSRGQKGRYI